MRLVLVLALAMILIISSAVSAMPTLFDVWGVGGTTDHLGTISAYSGNIDAASNYNYYSYSGHPINGPTPMGYQAFVWMYWDNTAAPGEHLSFNIINDVDGGGSPNNIVHWDFRFHMNNYSVLLQDDSGEGAGGFTDLGSGQMTGDFHYWYNTDGGVIGVDEPTCDSKWAIDFRGDLGDIEMLTVASGDGNDVMLWNSDQDYRYYRLTPQCEIPEPGTLLLLGSGLLFGVGAYRRKRK